MSGWISSFITARVSKPETLSAMTALAMMQFDRPAAVTN